MSLQTRLSALASAVGTDIGNLTDSLATKVSAFAQDSEPSSPAVGTLWIDTDEVAPVYPGPPLVPSLPTMPVDGQLVYFQTSAMAAMATSPIWLLRYSTATTKWHVVNGSPLFHTVAPWTGVMGGPDEITTSTTYADIPSGTVGPSIAIPVAGQYLVEITAWGRNQSVNGGDVYMSYDIGATPAVDVDGIVLKITTANVALQYGAGKRLKTLTAVTLTAKYKAPAGPTSALFRGPRTMTVTPMLLG